MFSTREDVAMSVFNAELRDLLAPALAAARSALRDLRSEEVPESLRRVVAHAGGRLPPPLASSLLSALDEDEWLRSKAAEKLGARYEASPAEAFLVRSERWWWSIAEALAAAGTADSGATAEKAQHEAASLKEKLAVAKRRLKRAGLELDAEKARARAVAPAPAIRDLSDEAKQASARIDELEGLLADATTDRVDAQAMIARLRSRLRRIAGAQRQQSASAAASSLGGDAVSTARNLDLVAAAAPHRITPDESRPVEQEGESTLQLPHGIRPDERAAIDWLVDGDVPVAVIVDGYNVLYGYDPATFTTAGSRNMLADQLTRLRRGAGVARVVVVYDSDLPGDREVHVLPGGIEVHFADEDELADDRIVELSAAAGGNVVVVTSDRELRDRSEAVGALTLWSESLVGWITPRT